MKRYGKKTEVAGGGTAELDDKALDGVAGGGVESVYLKIELEKVRVVSTSSDGGKTGGNDLLIGGSTSYDG